MQSILVQAWGEFLSQFHWDWFVTLTFEGDVKTFTAERRCKSWLRSLEKAAGMPIAWFCSDEYGDRTGRFHLHLLISNVSHLRRLTWMKRWEKNGYARIFAYIPDGAAPFYVSKYVTKQQGQWDIGGDLEAFRIQQPMLPLSGQSGSNADDGRVAKSDSKPTHSRRRSKEVQLPMADFTEPDPADPALDPLTLHLEKATRRRK